MTGLRSWYVRKQRLRNQQLDVKSYVYVNLHGSRLYRMPTTVMKCYA